MASRIDKKVSVINGNIVDILRKKCLPFLSSKKALLGFICSFFLCFEIISLGINSFVNRFISNGTIFDSLILYLLLVALLSYYVFHFGFRLNKEPIIVFLITALLFVSSIIIRPTNLDYVSRFDWIYIAIGVLCFFVVVQINDLSTIYQGFKKVYWIAILCGLLHLLFSKKEGEYYAWISDMTAGYALLPATLFAISYSFERKISIVFSIIGLVSLTLFGSRGPLLIAVVFFLFVLFLKLKTLGKGLLLLLLFLSFIILFNTQFIKEGLVAMSNLTLEHGFKIASLEKILYYNDFSNGRNGIYLETLNVISNNFAFGIGVFGDRSFSAYAHNIILEILVDFGVLIGIPIVIWFSYCVLSACKSLIKKHNDSFILFSILSFSILGQLLFSSSYLTNYLFYFYVGLLCAVVGQARIEDR